MTSLFTIELITRILAALAIIQSLEFRALSKATSDRGVWRWADIEPVLSGKSEIRKAFFGFFLGSHQFASLNFMRITIAVVMLIAPHPLGLFALLALHVLTLLRWLGSYNGGSDAMNLMLLWLTGFALWFEKSAGVALLWVIALQLCYSYVRAGLAKLAVAGWRNGAELRTLIASRVYEQNAASRFIAGSPALATAGAWALMIFELTFPLSLLDPRLAIAYMSAGLVFHLANAYFFGLNRFIFAWIAAYPAIYFCSLR